MIRRLAIAILLLGAAPAPAQSPAIAVAQARAAGLVGERYDGYLGLTGGGTLLQQQVNAVNIRRRALYSGLSERRGVALQEVALTAGCQLLGTIGVGERYLLSDNVWRVRGAGQPAPIPQYCR